MSPVSPSRIPVAIIFVSLSFSALRADDILLENGQHIFGTVIAQTRTEIRIATESGISTVSKSDIRRITYTPVDDASKREAEKKEKEAIQQREAEARKAQQDRLAEELRSRQQAEERARQEREEIHRAAVEERKLHRVLESERIRLQHAAGLIHLTGQGTGEGVRIEGIVMEKTGDDLHVKTPAGFLHLSADDIESMDVLEDDGEKSISGDQIRGVIEKEIQSGEMQLSGRDIIKARDVSSEGDAPKVATDVGVLFIAGEDVKKSGFPLRESGGKGILLQEGQTGVLVLAGSNERIQATLLKRSAFILIFQSPYGLLEFLPEDVFFAGSSDVAPLKK